MAEVSRDPAPGPGKEGWRVVMVAALPQEVRPFLRRSGAKRRRNLGLPAWEFPVGQGRGVLALAGMGAAAGQAAEALLARSHPRVLISLGFAGALTPELSPGDLVLGESFHSFDPERGGLAVCPAPPPPSPLAGLVQRLAEARLTASAASLVTTPYIIHKGRQGGPLLQLSRPSLDLESCYLAAAAIAAGVGFLGLRAITDAAGEEIPDFLRHPMPGGPPGLAAALSWVAADPRRAGVLLHLWRRSRLAARQLAAAALVLLGMLEK